MSVQGIEMRVSGSRRQGDAGHRTTASLLSVFGKRTTLLSSSAISLTPGIVHQV